MDTWKDAWVIFSKDIRLDRLYLLWNIAFMIYTGSMLSVMLKSREEVEVVLNPVSDFMALLLIPMLGFYMSRRSFNYIKDDTYTQMLLYYRILPIPIRTIMKSRLIQLGTAMLFNGLILFTTTYLMFYFIEINTSFVDYLVFVFTWIGFAIGMNGFYIYGEFLMKGKAYLGATFLMVVVALTAAISIAIAGGNLMEYTLRVSEGYGLRSPLMWGTLVGGIIMLRVLCLITERKLVKRSFR